MGRGGGDLADGHTALTQLDRYKNGSDKLSAEAREAIRWLDDITSTPSSKDAGMVELQGVDEAYNTWAEVEQFLLPETLLSMESDDVSSVAESLDKNLSIKEEEEAMSSTDSLDACSQSPSSRRSTNSSSAPDFSLASPKKWKQSQSGAEVVNGSDTPVQHSHIPVSLQPLFNHILWRIHADPRAGLSMPDSYILLTNDPMKQNVAHKFGIRAKRLEQLRDIVAREERDYKNRLLVLRKEATLSESELARQKGKITVDEDDEVVVFRPRQSKQPQQAQQAQKAQQQQPAQKGPPTGPKVFDPNAFGRAATGISPGRGGRGGGGGGRGRGGFSQSSRGRNTGSPAKPVRTAPIDLTQPIDPDSFARPSPASRGGRGGRRRLWEST